MPDKEIASTVRACKTCGDTKCPKDWGACYGELWQPKPTSTVLTEPHTARELAIIIAQDTHTRQHWAQKLRAELDWCEPVLYRKFVESIERITKEMEA